MGDTTTWLASQAASLIPNMLPQAAAAASSSSSGGSSGGGSSGGGGASSCFSAPCQSAGGGILNGALFVNGTYAGQCCAIT